MCVRAATRSLPPPQIDMKLPALAATLEVAIAAGLETTSSSLGMTASERQTQIVQTHVAAAHEHDAVAKLKMVVVSDAFAL